MNKVDLRVQLGKFPADLFSLFPSVFLFPVCRASSSSAMKHSTDSESSGSESDAEEENTSESGSEEESESEDEGEGCVMLTDVPAWDDTSCAQTRPAICRKTSSE